MRAVTDPIAKNWFSTVYSELKGNEHFRTLFTKYLWNSPTQSRIRCSIYQDKFTRQETSHYPILVQRSLLSGNIKTMQDAKNLLGKLDALEAQDDHRNPRQNSENHDANRRTQYSSWSNRTDRNQRDFIRVEHVQYADESNYDRQ
jgi:hypothetical protein